VEDGGMGGSRVIVKNNLIAIAIHALISFILVFSLFLIKISTLEILGFSTLIVFFLYFWAGRRFLSNTNNVLTNMLSVTAPAIILIILIVLYCIDIWYLIDTMGFFNPFGLSIWLSIYLMRIPIPNDWITVPVWAISPSLAMWIGVTTKRPSAKQANNVSPDNKELSHEEN
jgi:hypothetical protein